MRQQPAPEPDRQPLDQHAAESVLGYAAAERAKTDVLASVLEDIPAPWETARGTCLARLADEQPRVA